MRFLFFTDLHLTGRNPPNRKDKYPLTLLRKLREVYELADSENVDFVLFGGDLFDAHRCYAYEVLAGAVNIIRNAPCATYMIIGQHDLIGYNKTTFGYSTANFVAELSGGKLRIIDQPISDKGGPSIFPCHVYDNLPEVMEVAGKSGCNFPIVVAHALVTSHSFVYETTLLKDLPQTGVKLLLCGDYHGGIEFTKCGDMWAYNPGAMARQKFTASEQLRVVKCAIIEVDNGIMDLKEYPLKSALPASDVFIEKEPDEIDPANGVDVDSFIEKLERLSCEATDIFQLLEMMADGQTDTRILRYIDSFRKDEK